jgi:copper chaperone CopZ
MSGTGEECNKNGCCGGSSSNNTEEKAAPVLIDAATLREKCADSCCEAAAQLVEDVACDKSSTENCGDDRGTVEANSCTAGCCDEEKKASDSEFEPFSNESGGEHSRLLLHHAATDACCKSDGLAKPKKKKKKKKKPKATIVDDCCKDGACCDELSTGSCCNDDSCCAGAEKRGCCSEAASRRRCGRMGDARLKKVKRGKRVCHESAAAVAAASKTTLSVSGMTCTGCATSAETLLRKVAGVGAVEASFLGARVVVQHDAVVVTPAALCEALKKLNFTATVTSSVGVTSDGTVVSSDERIVMVVAADGGRVDDATVELMRACEGVQRVERAESAIRVVVANDVARRDAVLALAAAGLPSRVVADGDGATSTAAANERRESTVWLRRTVALLALALALALMTFAFYDRVGGVAFVSVGFVLCTLGVLAGATIFVSAYKSLRYAHEANMDCLIALSSGVAYIYSTVASIVWLAQGADETALRRRTY